MNARELLEVFSLPLMVSLGFLIFFGLLFGKRLRGKTGVGISLISILLMPVTFILLAILAAWAKFSSHY